MIISHRRTFIFLESSKAAGTSMEIALSCLAARHYEISARR